MFLFLAWLIAIVYATVPSYWLVVHGRAAQWATQGGKRLSVVGPVWLLMWIAAGVATQPWRNVTLYRSTWGRIPGGLLVGCGILVYLKGRRNFSTAQVLGRSELQPQRHEQRLVTSGLRARIRHPYYLGHLCELTGWTVGSGLIVCYVLLGFALITGYAMIRAEERELEQRFGEAYSAYRSRSAAIFPGLW